MRLTWKRKNLDGETVYIARYFNMEAYVIRHPTRNVSWKTILCDRIDMNGFALSVREGKREAAKAMGAPEP